MRTRWKEKTIFQHEEKTDDVKRYNVNGLDILINYPHTSADPRAADTVVVGLRTDQI